MTEDVSFKELARIMAERDVSALPVLDHQGRVTGVVSETDLLRKEEYQKDRRRSGRRGGGTTMPGPVPRVTLAARSRPIEWRPACGSIRRWPTCAG